VRCAAGRRTWTLHDLQSWAERLLHAPGSPEVIDLHVKDVLAAFLTGIRTNDGKALLHRYGGSSDRGELAAAVSAIARLSECDDIHLASCVTPGAIVIPVALALTGNCSTSDFNSAVSAGYAAGSRLGTAIGGARALTRGTWPTLLAAPLMAAVTASCLARRDPDRLAHAMALALAGANGRVGNPAARWTLLADAVLRGLRAAEAAGKGDRGDLNRLPDDADMEAFEAADASISTVGFKPFPIARQGANAVVVFRHLLSKRIDLQQIDAVDVFVPAVNVALLTRPVSESDRLSRLCNLGLQLACAAFAPELLYDPERAVAPNAPLLQFASLVSVSAAPDLETHWPDRWAARVAIHMGAERLEETVIRAPFDHDAPHLSKLLTDKWWRLLSPQDEGLLLDGPRSGHHATLWQRIERRVSMTAED
jgi:2-methylcitrate dehydratase PrpD